MYLKQLKLFLPTSKKGGSQCVYITLAICFIKVQNLNLKTFNVNEYLEDNNEKINCYSQ